MSVDKGVFPMKRSEINYEYITWHPERYNKKILPKWSKELSDRGYKGVSARDFYDDIFFDDLAEARLPEDYKTGEYSGIAVERILRTDKDGNPILDDKGRKTYKGRRTQITRGNKALYDLIDRSENFCLIAPISYAGRTRTNEHARYMYAFCIEVDYIQEKNGLAELIYSWERKNQPVPKPTYVVCSGNGLHLYYVFERPVPMWQNIFEAMKAYKKYMTPRLWTKYITSAYEKIEFESVNQPFRIVGTRASNGGCVLAFRVGEKVTIEYMNSFVPPECAMTNIYKPKHNLQEAQELFPEWYQRRIVEKKGREHWNRHEGIYYNWIEKILKGAVVGHRYNCLENLCSLAVQCEIPAEQVVSDCRKVAEHLETLTVSEDNHFTEYDIICALKTYHQAKEQAYRRKIEFISKKTGIELKPNKRNGRKQAAHIKLMNYVRDEINGHRDTWRNKDGRPKGSGTKAQIVRDWRAAHPDGKKIDCERELKISRPTILKWWDVAERNNT